MVPYSKTSATSADDDGIVRVINDCIVSDSFLALNMIRFAMGSYLRLGSSVRHDVRERTDAGVSASGCQAATHCGFANKLQNIHFA